MFELLLVGGVVALLVAIAALGTLPWDSLFSAGLGLMFVGLAIGIPASAYYHMQLYRQLRRRGEIPKRWWLNPTALHGVLREQERTWVMSFFAIGAIGFMLTVLGCVVIAVGVGHTP